MLGGLSTAPLEPAPLDQERGGGQDDKGHLRLEHLQGEGSRSVEGQAQQPDQREGPGEDCQQSQAREQATFGNEAGDEGDGHRQEEATRHAHHGDRFRRSQADPVRGDGTDRVAQVFDADPDHQERRHPEHEPTDQTERRTLLSLIGNLPRFPGETAQPVEV